MLNCIKTGEEIVYEEWKTCNSACEHFTERKKRIAAILAHPFLEEIVKTLRSDINVWALDGTDSKIRWVAEQLVLNVYDIESDITRQTFPVNASFVNSYYNESRKLRNEFFDLVPDFDDGVRVSEIKNSLNPNGTLDFWVALYAFNSFRFHLIDLMEAFRVAEPIHIEDDYQTLESTLVCEKLILNSARVREHACMSVLFKAQQILRKIDMSSSTLMKRSIAKTSNASNLFLLVKTILGNMHAYRLLIKEGRISVLCELIRNTGCWASMRSPSMIVLNCAKNNREFHELYKAVVQYEVACIRECTAMTKLFYSNDIVAQFMEDDDLAVEMILKRSFLKVQICLIRQDSETDDRIFKSLTSNERDLIQVFHYQSFYFARPSIVFPCFLQVLQIAAQETDNPLMVICNLVTNDRLISLLKRSIDGIDPRLYSDLQNDVYFDSADISVQELYKLVRDEAEKRQNLEGDADAFYALQYNENELLVLSKVIATFGWDS